jgi:hypothetical protein
MQFAYFTKIIVFLALIFLCAPFSHAQTANQGLDYLKSLNDAQIDNFINQNVNRTPSVPYSDYQNIITDIRNIANTTGAGINDSSLSSLLESIKAGGQTSQDIGLLNRVTDKIISGSVDTNLANSVLDNVGAGNISSRIASYVTSMQNADVIKGLNEVFDTINSIPGFDQSALNDVVQGFIDTGLTSLTDKIPDLKKYADLIKDAKDKISDLATLEGLVKKFADGSIPTELIDSIKGKLDKFDELKDIFDGEQFLKALEVFDELEAMLDDPQKLLEAVAGVGELTKLIKGFEGLDIDDFFSDFPDSIKDALIAEFGSLEAVLELLAELLGDDVDGGNDEECGAKCKPCDDCKVPIIENHQRIRSHVTAEFELHRNWIVTEFFTKHVAPAMAEMTSQLVTVGMQQVNAIGQFFDAKHQLETQRLFQTMVAEAHKDYQPSEGLCAIGTGLQSMANSQRRSDLSQVALSEQMMNRQLATANTVAGGGADQDRRSRLNLFIEKFCRKSDHGGAMTKLCQSGASSPTQANMDIDYTNAFSNKLTLEFDPLDDISSDTTKDEENLYALSSNLFANQILTTFTEDELVLNGEPTDKVKDLMLMRAIGAKRSVAQNSFAAIASMKAESNGKSGPFLKAVLAEAGVEPDHIQQYLGENPSYYAQMQVLTKEIYKDPSFYANLYDKPANIDRKGVALLALELMQDRDIYDSLLRSEAVLATMIEVLVSNEQKKVNEDLSLVGTSGVKINSVTPTPDQPIVGPQ